MSSSTNNRKKTQRGSLLVAAAIITVAMTAGNTYAADNDRGRSQRSERHDQAKQNDSHHDSHGSRNNYRNRNRDNHNRRNRGLFDLFFSIGNRSRYDSSRHSYESSNHHNGGQCNGGYYKQVWVAPVYRTYRDSCGYGRNELVRPGYYRQAWQPRVCTMSGHHHNQPQRYQTSGITIGGHYRR